MKPSELRTSLTLRTGLILLLVSSFLVTVRAADTVESALQRGLVAEEAQRDLRTAAEAYQQAVRLGDQQREAQATAIYRLGEVQRRLGNTDAARVQFLRLLTEFPDQTNLVALARSEIPQASPASAQEPLVGQFLAEAEFQRDTAALQLAKLNKAIANFQTGSRSNLVQLLAFRPNRLLETLLADLNISEQQRSRLSPDFAPQHPEVVRVEVILRKINEQIQEVAQGIKAALIEEQATASLLVARLEGRVTSLKELQRAAQQNPKNPDIVDLLKTPPQTPAMSPEEAEELERLKKLAAESPDLLGKVVGGSTPLTRAGGKGWTNVVSYLLDQGVSIEVGFPLHRAAQVGNLDLVTLLLRRGANPNSRNTVDGTPLHCSARAGRRAVAEKLIQSGAEIDSRTTGQNPASTLETVSEGNTPLHLAAYNGMPAVVELLLEKGADITATNTLAMTPLFTALLGHQTVTFKQLVDFGADMSVVADLWQLQGLRAGKRRTLLHLAAAYGEKDIVKLLLKYGVNPNSADSYGNTPLHYAQNSEVGLALIDAGAQVNALSLESRTPLDELVSGSSESSPTVRALIRTLGGTNSQQQNRNPSAGVPTSMARPATRITGELVAKLDLGSDEQRSLRDVLIGLSIPKSADLTRVSITRPNPNGSTNWVVDFSNTKHLDTKIIAGDSIYIPARPVKK